VWLRPPRSVCCVAVYVHARSSSTTFVVIFSCGVFVKDRAPPGIFTLSLRDALPICVADRFAVRQGDAFAVLEALGGEGERFDLVICDPPAFAPAKTRARGGLARL